MPARHGKAVAPAGRLFGCCFACRLARCDACCSLGGAIVGSRCRFACCFGLRNGGNVAYPPDDIAFRATLFAPERRTGHRRRIALHFAIPSGLEIMLVGSACLDLRGHKGRPELPSEFRSFSRQVPRRFRGNLDAFLGEESTHVIRSAGFYCLLDLLESHFYELHVNASFLPMSCVWNLLTDTKASCACGQIAHRDSVDGNPFRHRSKKPKCILHQEERFSLKKMIMIIKYGMQKDLLRRFPSVFEQYYVFLIAIIKPNSFAGGRWVQ